MRERYSDLLGDNGWRWRILRTSEPSGLAGRTGGNYQPASLLIDLQRFLVDRLQSQLGKVRSDVVQNFRVGCDENISACPMCLCVAAAEAHAGANCAHSQSWQCGGGDIVSAPAPDIGSGFLAALGLGGGLLPQDSSRIGGDPDFSRGWLFTPSAKPSEGHFALG